MATRVQTQRCGILYPSTNIPDKISKSCLIYRSWQTVVIFPMILKPLFSAWKLWYDNTQ